MAIKSPLILSLHVGLPRTMGAEAGSAGPPDPDDPDQGRTSGEWTSAIFKEPVEGPVWLSSTGLAGDGVADREDHGGPEMAVMAYAADHYAAWRSELAQPFLKFGAFGENVSISRVDEESVCVGDIYAVGDARLQVSKPRLPCWKLARRLGVKDIVARVHEKAWGGWYLRVLREGHVERGNFAVLEERPCPQWTVSRAYRVFRNRREDRQAAAELAACSLLSAGWREKLRSP
jgi:MOSC domain-containing protein YiiM